METSPPANQSSPPSLPAGAVDKRLHAPPKNRKKNSGLQAAIASTLFLGMAPVFGKQAILTGFPPLAVVALRTVFAALLLLLVLVIKDRRTLYIYPAGALGCLIAGSINGIGSLMYYSALGRLDASVGQMLYALYPLFVAMWLWLDHQPPSRLTLLRLILAIPGVYLITQSGHNSLDPIGMLLMLGAAVLYALHLPINQRVLFDMPAPTVTLYTLVAMSLVVIPGYLLSGAPALPSASQGWWAVGGLTLVTFLSRLLLFLGVKHLGGMQTALLGLGELLVTIALAYLWIGERLTPLQWLGALALSASLVLVGFENIQQYSPNQSKGWLRWLTSPKLPPDVF